MRLITDIPDCYYDECIHFQNCIIVDREGDYLPKYTTVQPTIFFVEATLSERKETNESK